jgi:nitrate reductase NapE component
MVGAPLSNKAPRMGSAPLAAFLKNSLLDWSSSLFLSFSIFPMLKIAAHSPNAA